MVSFLFVGIAKVKRSVISCQERCTLIVLLSFRYFLQEDGWTYPISKGGFTTTLGIPLPCSVWGAGKENPDGRTVPKVSRNKQH
ncbi:hypothetical protein GDO78_017719 [Eleutherodactylus coqui]|uniref:Uncharacterized protein n=1 Tax=Eleutherodactylus coqui TaxID=57060 RepID=A0A8J6C2Q7_ELECQ|nr:hypothetical protein GDO78_017719 [Eleutherodactylus coqui]